MHFGTEFRILWGYAMQLDEIDIPKGKFILLGGGATGELGFSLCGTYATLEEAKFEKDVWVAKAPFYASRHADDEKPLSQEILSDPQKCLEYLGMAFDIYDDQKQRVG